MKLQRQQGRKYKDKIYDKWVVVIPKEDIERLGWNEGDELVGIVAEDIYILRRNGAP